MNNFNDPPIQPEQRAAPRYIARLEAAVLINAIFNIDTDHEECLFLQGAIRDVSLSGLALVISRKDRQELADRGDRCIMRLLLPLPSEAIEVEIDPVRFQPLAAGEEVLIGAYITGMCESGRRLFIKFISDCATSPPPRPVLDTRYQDRNSLRSIEPFLRDRRA